MATKIISSCGSAYSAMKYETFEKDEEGKYAECFDQCRVKVRASAHEDNAEDILVVFKKIMRELWDSSIDKQFDHNWKKVIEFMLSRLPGEWTDAVRENYHQDMLIQLGKLQTDNGKFRHGLKGILLNTIGRECLAVLAMQNLIGHLRDDIADKLRISKQWTPKMVRFLWEFLVCNWGTIVKQFYNPHTFVDGATLQSPDLLGLRGLLISFILCHLVRTPLGLSCKLEFLRSILDIDYYQWGSQLEKIHFPSYLSRHGNALTNLIFDRTQNDAQHIVRKNNLYPIPVVLALCNNHEKIYADMMNTAQYKNDMGIDCDLVNTGSLTESFGVAINNFEGSSKTLTTAQEQAIQNTIDNVASHKFDSSFAKCKLGLCMKVRELAEECMLFFFAFVLFFFAFVFVFFLCCCCCISCFCCRSLYSFINESY